MTAQACYKHNVFDSQAAISRCGPWLTSMIVCDVVDIEDKDVEDKDVEDKDVEDKDVEDEDIEDVAVVVDEVLCSSRVILHLGSRKKGVGMLVSSGPT